MLDIGQICKFSVLWSWELDKFDVRYRSITFESVVYRGRRFDGSVGQHWFHDRVVFFVGDLPLGLVCRRILSSELLLLLLLVLSNIAESIEFVYGDRRFPNVFGCFLVGLGFRVRYPIVGDSLAYPLITFEAFR